MEILREGNTVKSFVCDSCDCAFQLSHNERFDRIVEEEELKDWLTEVEYNKYSDFFKCPECDHPIGFN